MTTLATLVVKIVGDINEYSTSLQKAQNTTDSFAGNAVNGLSAIGGTIVIGALTGAATAAAAIGTAAWNSAETMDKAYDTIQTQTGATGETLKILQKDFDNVFKNVPTDAGQAADVVSALNQKLGLTGPVLDTSSIKLLNMTNLLGGDAKTNATLFGRTMQDAGLPVEQAGILLDKLFVASQKSGIGVDELMQKMVQFGAPMRNMGFDLDTSIALFAKWEKEGVNAELVMGSLRIAAGNFAKDGVPLNQGLADTIEKIKGAKDASEALVIAQGIFGARAAGDMAAAIREGRFDIDDMTAAIQGSQGAINKTAAETEDWGEKWTKFTNRLTVSLTPIGNVLRGVADQAMEMLNAFLERPEVQKALDNLATWIADMAKKAEEWIPKVQQWFADLWKWFQDNQWVVVAVLAVIGAAIVTWAITSALAIAPLLLELMPVVLLILFIAAVAVVLYIAWTENWGGIREKTAEVWAWLEPKLKSLVTWFQTDVPQALKTLSTYIQETLLPAIRRGWLGIEGRVHQAVRFIEGLLDDLTVVFETWKTNTILLFQGFWAAVHGDWRTAGLKLGTMMGNTFDLLDEITRGRLTSLKAIWNFGLDDIIFIILNVKDWHGVGIKVMELIKAGFEFGLWDLFGLIFTVLGNLAKAIADFISGLMSGANTASDVQKMLPVFGLGGGAGQNGLGGGADLGGLGGGTGLGGIGGGAGGSSGLNGLGAGIKSRFDGNGGNPQQPIINVNIDHHPTISAQNDQELQAKIETAVVNLLKKYKINLAN